jgi:hypothetical protein
MKKDPKDKMFSIRIPGGLLDKYRNYCEDNSINISKRIRAFMEKELDAWDKKQKSK